MKKEKDFAVWFKFGKYIVNIILKIVFKYIEINQ